jgi:DNA-binding MarR family transcriptional regulator
MATEASSFAPCRSCVCAGLRAASRAVTQHFERHFRGSGLRGTQFSVLAMLAQTGPLPMSILARQLGLERTTLTRNLRPLLTRGFIKSTTGEDGKRADGRVRRVELTPAGRAAAKKALPRWQRAQDSVGPVLKRWGLDGLHGFMIGSVP